MDLVKSNSHFEPSSDFILHEGDILGLMPQVPERFVRLVVTSPPYNLGKPYEEKQDIQDYLKNQEQVIRECVRVLKDDGSLCWQVGNFVFNSEIIPLDILLFPIFSGLGLHLRNRIIWQFGHGLHASRRFSGRYEVILWFTKSEQYVFNLDEVRVPQKYPQKRHFKGPKKGELSGHPLGKNPSDVWEIPNVKSNHVEKTEHPCQFPIELVERLVLALTNPSDWVLDPYMGVGSTAIAALMHQLKAIGAEIMPEYVEIAKERVHLGEQGKLRIRPMEREVYDPNGKNSSVPPKTVQLGKPAQYRLLDDAGSYTKSGE